MWCVSDSISDRAAVVKDGIGPGPRKVDTSGVSYAALVSVAEVSASKTSGATRLHHECRRRVLQRMHHRKTSCRQAIGLSKTLLSRKTSRVSVALNDSARALTALVPTEGVGIFVYEV